MPATACFRSRPLRKIRDGNLEPRSALIPNLPDVRCEVVERQQLASSRTIERDLEVRQECVVGRDLGLPRATRGNRREPGGARRGSASREERRRGAMRGESPAELIRRSDGDADEKAG